MAQATDSAPYRVLARKYRPATFAELIGQDAMVRTLRNAIASGRIAHAFILTGVRGVGKTTTARIIARVVNCVGKDGAGGPTADPCGQCEHCVAIAEDRHVDVIEMDAASRTGVDDIRDLIDGVLYRPVSARYKVYIIDEVHMLTKNAFNALLKTLEEPPPHVKFVFATTEIRKVPVTVLSRCQRFDLRRVDAEALGRHFAAVLDAEGVSISPDALREIVRAADGSVRDGLSLLDQAIAHTAAGAIEADMVRDMLGLADRVFVFDLFDSLMAGDAAKALGIAERLHDAGADPATVVADLLEIAHWLTRLKIAPDDAASATASDVDRARAGEMADRLTVPHLARAWQMLLKGIAEVRSAPHPIQAVEMLLVRLCYAADLPTPAELVAELAGNAAPADRVAVARQPPDASAVRSDLAGRRREPTPAGPSAPSSALAVRAEPTAAREDDPVRQPQSFDELVDLFRRMKEPKLWSHLMNDVHLVHFERCNVELRLGRHAPSDLANQMMRLLREWTGEKWFVTLRVDVDGAPTLRAQRDEVERAARDAAANHPTVRAALEAFPGARFVGVVEREAEVPAPSDAAPDDIELENGDDPA
jgi:DNA polymerase-3 subunit gamma/tau